MRLYVFNAWFQRLGKINSKILSYDKLLVNVYVCVSISVNGYVSVHTCVEVLHYVVLFVRFYVLIDSEF